MTAPEYWQPSAKANFVPEVENVRKALKGLLGFEVYSATRQPSPAPGDRSIRDNAPARQGWRIVLRNGWAVIVDSSDDIRDPRRLNVWRYAATRSLGNESTALPLLSRTQARQVLILLHELAELAEASDHDDA